MIEVRKYQKSDIGQLADLFHLSVNQSALSAYSKAECHAWSPEVRSAQIWHERLEGTQTWVAHDADTLIGFINLKPHESMAFEAEIDCLFIHPNYLRKGIASQLYQALYNQVIADSITRLTTQASYLAKPFFAKQGFTVINRNEHVKAGQVLINFSMDKII